MAFIAGDALNDAPCAAATTGGALAESNPISEGPTLADDAPSAGEATEVALGNA